MRLNQLLEQGECVGARFDVRVEFEGGFRFGLGLGEALHLEEYDGVVCVSVCVGGVELNGLLQMEGGLLPVSLAGEQAAEVGLGCCVVGVDGEGCAECGFGVARVSGLGEDYEPRLFCASAEAGLELERLSEVGDGLVGASGF